MQLLEAFGGVLLFFAVSLVPWGGFGLGKVEEKSAALISLICGVLSVIWAFAFIFPLSPATAAVVASFAFAFISGGWHVYNGISLKGHGLLCWTLAMIVGMVSAISTSASAPYVTIANWSYFTILVLFGGGSYIGTPRWIKAFAYVAFFVGIVTCGIFGTLWVLGILPA